MKNRLIILFALTLVACSKPIEYERRVVCDGFATPWSYRARTEGPVARWGNAWEIDAVYHIPEGTVCKVEFRAKPNDD